MSRLTEIVTHLAGRIEAGQLVPKETNPIIIVALLNHLARRGMNETDAIELIWRKWQRFETRHEFDAEIRRTSELIETLVVSNKVGEQP